MTNELKRVSRLKLLIAVTFASICLSGAAVAREKMQLERLSNQHDYDQFIVRFNDDSTVRVDESKIRISIDGAASRLSMATGKSVSIVKVRRMLGSSELIRTSRPLDRVEAGLLMRQLADDPSVEHVEPDLTIMAFADVNDPYLSAQWHLQSSLSYGTSAKFAWSNAIGTGVVIGIIDSGLTPHPDIDPARIVPGYDFITNVVIAKDGNGRDSDPSDPGSYSPGIILGCDSDAFCSTLGDSTWHGTRVAGIAAATANNNYGGAGVAPGAKVMPIRVLGKGGRGKLSDLIDAIRWAGGVGGAGLPSPPSFADRPRVINMSLGFPTTAACSSELQSAINQAYAQGVTLVAAAGNSSSLANAEPAKCDNVISVAATNNLGNRSDFSSYADWITIAAPGGEGVDGDAGDILTTSNSGWDGPISPNFVQVAGTSMSAPQVSGAAAVLLSYAASRSYCSLSPGQIKNIIINGSRPFPAAQPAGMKIGAGILDVSSSLLEIGKICDVMTHN